MNPVSLVFLAGIIIGMFVEKMWGVISFFENLFS